MRDFIIGIIVGIILGTTSAYGIIKQKAKKAVTKENAEKVVKSVGKVFE